MSIYYWLIGHKSRVTYWTCSSFSNWLRVKLGVEAKPDYATTEGWSGWHQINKGKIGYWITEEGLDILQDIVYFPHDVYRNIKTYIHNRFINKPHYIDTKLKRGDWHENDTRILHGLMETIVDFVEVEKARKHQIGKWINQDEQKFLWIWKRRPWKREWKTPNRKDGIAYLDWEIALEDESPHQSEAAKEILELYLWWKDVRPARPDPWDESGLSDFYDSRRSDDGYDGIWGIRSNQTPEEKAAYRTMSDKVRDIEKHYDDEDEEMLIRVIKIRKAMWS